MTNRFKAPAVMMLATLALAGCDILDVSNPNNLVEESIRQESAASAVVNGALSLTASSVSQVWQPYLVATDELFWVGSRDAWLSLDQGFVSDPSNEFTDGAFPSMGQARWMGDEAIEILQEHVANNPSTALKTDLARAYLYSGIMYMVIGEVQEDFAFSDKTEDGAPVGPDNMSSVLDQAIAKLDQAVSMAQEVGDSDLHIAALGTRARAKHSRAIWDAINPSPSGNGLVNSASAETDALAVIGMAGGVTADWEYTFSYSAGTVTNSLASWVNSRKENQVDLSLVTLDAAFDINGIALQDPIDGVDDPALIKRLNLFKGGQYTDKGGQYPDMTITSTRLMHLIAAENALATGNNAGFNAHINHVRAMDGLTPYSGQTVDAPTLLEHTRRVNTTLMGLRLADMYRFGITDALWEPNGDALSAPGSMLPITLIEIRANCHLNGLGC